MTMLMGDQSTAGGDTPPGGRTPVNRILLNGQILDVRPRSMTMDRSVGKHDGVTLALSSTTLDDTEDILEQPISFAYGIGARLETFYGYVTQVMEEQKNSTNLNFTLKLLGTTMRMQGVTPRFWANKSIPAVVRDLAHANLLGFSGTGHPHQWKSLAQTSESDWAISQALSVRIGYALFNWNGVVICEDPRAMYNSNGPYLRLTMESNIESAHRQLLDFVPTRESEATYTGMGVRIAYLTSDGKVAFGKQANYEKHRFESSLPVRSQHEAEIYIAAADLNNAYWHQQAMARINGDPTIYPGMCVDIVTATRLKEKKYDGKWLVTAVKHQMDNQSFQTALGLARPTAATSGQVMPFRSFWEGDTKGKPTMWLQDGQWMSSWSDSRSRSVQ